jgi:hypothetical protein
MGAKAGKKLVEASISAETGITVKGKIVAPGETKVFKVGISQPSIIFEGLAMKASFKSLTGKWKDKGTSQKFTLLEPEVLFTGTDVNLIGE